MPATYAHYRFGQAVLARLPERERKIISSEQELFSIGLHGPDILFYYRPLSSNPICKTGYDMHNQPGLAFFQAAGDRLKAQHFAPAPTAYLYGFLCHFALDVACHGYVGEKEAASGVSHGEIETEFDRFLLTEEGRNPVKTSITGHFHPSRRSAEVIAGCFGNLSPGEVLEALRSFRFFHWLFLAPSRVKRGALFAGLKLAGQYDAMRGLVMNRVPNPLCQDSCLRLQALSREAEDTALRLIPGFRDTVSGSIPWDGIYQYDFSSQYKGGNHEV